MVVQGISQEPGEVQGLNTHLGHVPRLQMTGQVQRKVTSLRSLSWLETEEGPDPCSARTPGQRDPQRP